MRQCPNGHFYDENRYAACPYCDAGSDAGKTVATADFQSGADIGKTVAAAPDLPEDSGKTVAFLEQQIGFDPVVGFVVCIEGPMKGADFRLHSGRNFIGRSASMNVSLADDNAVSRENHAVISYDDRHNQFRVAAGTGRGLTYLNDEEIENARDLKAYDVIEVGRSKLLFVPVCGSLFKWPVEE